MTVASLFSSFSSEPLTSGPKPRRTAIGVRVGSGAGAVTVGAAPRSPSRA